MRKAARAMALAVLVLLSSVVLGVVSAMTAALTLAATALIVPGTGTHNINPPNAVTGYKENARDRFMTTTPCTVANGCTGVNLVGIDYPASFWPIPLPNWCPGLSCDTWNESVGTGVTNLDGTLIPLLNSNPGEQFVVFGYSQGGAVVSTEMVQHLASLPQAQKDQLTVVTIGNILGPQGLWTRIGFLPTIPILDITPRPTLPTNIGIESVNYNFEYDPVGDFPLYLLNPLALLNALAAFQYVHGNYLVPNSNDLTGALPYGYTDATLAAAISDPANIRTYQDGTFILIPHQGTLPIYQPFVDLASATGTTALVQPIVDLISPVTKVLINLGYNRTLNPGIPQTLQLFPIVNPVTLTVDLINAGIQGIQDAFGDLGASTLTTPSEPDTQLSLATRSRDDSVSPLKTDPQVTVGLGETKPVEISQRTTSERTAKQLTVVKPEASLEAESEGPKPKVKPGNMFTPGDTTPAQLQSEATNKQSTTATPTTTGLDTTEADAKAPTANDPETGNSPSTGENSSANASQAAAA